ncbi:MAG: histidine ammonia-lyase [Pyrinomonadaceae bacterium]|nr:histidine ammonia-lyase [Pyrinomonadaceae bacterium]
MVNTKKITSLKTDFSCSKSAVFVDGKNLTFEHLSQLENNRTQFLLSATAKQKVEKSYCFLTEKLKSGAVVYGINTGFGRLANVSISNKELTKLQLNLVRSHCCGIGKPLSITEARTVLLLRANVLAKGHSGARPVVVETLLEMLNRGVTPVIPEKGSVGASGDLSPLAHAASVLIGEGAAFYQGEIMPGGEALKRAEIKPLTLEAKEGLALINGTEALTAVGAIALKELKFLCQLADICGAMTLEALYGKKDAFNALIHQMRPFNGQIAVAENLLNLTEGSEILVSEKAQARVQDAYSLRCMPQVHGAVRDALAHVEHLCEIEFNSATDNPLIFPDEDKVLSGGNFHGEALAMAFDYAAIAASELGAISERRIERLVNPDLSGLPAFLVKESGINSGFMIAHVTAVALCGENKVLAHPASTDSLPTSAGTEDHVSMGMTSALKLRTITENLKNILAIEMLAAAQALEFAKPMQPGKPLREIYRKIREIVPPMLEDAPFSPLIEELSKNLNKIIAINY